MADKVIQMQVRNEANTAWDNIYPQTKADSVLMGSGKSVEQEVVAHQAETASQEALGHIKIGTGGSIDENGVYVPSGFKVGGFSRDMSLGNGNQAITGVGFKPRAIICFGFTVNTGSACFGMVGSGGSRVMNTYPSKFEGTPNYPIKYADGTNAYYGVMLSFNNDGFTITWNSVGSPTGTLNVYYIAIK